MSNLQWWEAPSSEEAARLLAAAVETLSLHPEQMAREDRYLDYARLHSNQELRTLRCFSDASDTPDTINPGRFGYNLCRSAPNSVAPKLLESLARVQVSTNGGTRRERRRAEKASAFIDGMFWVSGFNKARVAALQDALVFDLGAVKWSKRGPRLVAARVPAWEVMWDPADGRDGDPACLYHPQRLHWAQVCAEWNITGEKRETIRSKAMGSAGYVWIDEGWCKPYDLPPSTERKPEHLAKFKQQPECYGRHVVQCMGVLILDEPWCKPYHAIQVYRWAKREIGFAGMGLVEQALPYYSEILRLLETWRKNHKLGATLKVAVQHGTTIGAGSVSNEPGSEYKYKDKPPMFWVPDVRSGEHLNDADRLYQMGLRELGLSDMDVAGRAQPGIDSGVALREIQAITTKRFEAHLKEFDQFGVDCAEVGLDMAKDLYAENGSFVVRAPGTRLIEETDLAEIDLEEDGYILQPEPVSAIPRGIAGKKQWAAEERKAGNLDQQEYLEMVYQPDQLATLGRKLAPRRRIERILDDIMDKGKYETPDEFIAHDLAIQMGVQAINDAESEKVPAKRVRLLRQFVDECARVKKQIETNGGETPAAAALLAQNQAAAEAVQAANGNALANPGGAPMTPMAPGVPLPM